MIRLTKGMYGHEFDPMSSLFGLCCGQIRGHDLVHNGGWYNKQGEKLGWGDLSPEDFQRISDALEDGEFFIILPEHASFWNFVTKSGTIGSLSAVKPDIEAPGTEFVVEKCAFIIAKNQLYYVDHHGFGREIWVRDGVQFKVLKQDAAKKLIAS